MKRWLSFDNQDDSYDDDSDDHKDNYDADFAHAGDDPPLAIPGCSTKASQFQVSDILLQYD